jgi:hypothetical protein
MKENTLNKLFIICCLLTTISCKARKLATTNTTAATIDVKNYSAIEAKLAPVRSHQLVFNTFSGKARTSLNINGNSNDCTLNIRIANNKKIWVSVTALLGIEVARAVITPDSVQIINRIQGLYVKKPFSFIYAYTNKQINYNMLQALLVGNAVPSLLNDTTDYVGYNNNIVLSGNIQNIIYKLILDSDMRVTQTNLSSESQGVSLQVSNNNFIQSGTQKLPSQIDIASVAKDKKIQVNLHYVKVDLNQVQEYPFSIPSSYSPQN